MHPLLAFAWFLLLRSVSAFSWDSPGRSGSNGAAAAGGLRRPSTAGAAGPGDSLPVVIRNGGQQIMLDVQTMGKDRGGKLNMLPVFVTSSSSEAVISEQSPRVAAADRNAVRPPTRPSSARPGSDSDSDSNGIASFAASLASSIEDEQEDHPLFGLSCHFLSTFTTCGDYYSPKEGVDHGLFCSPDGVCAGQGAACGASEACGRGLTCDFQKHRCVQKARLMTLTREQARLEQRRKSAAASCPPGSEICPTGAGGFQCVYTGSEVTECGACLRMGGSDCHAIPNVLATSCRNGKCFIHACVDGYEPSSDGADCHEIQELGRDL